MTQTNKTPPNIHSAVSMRRAGRFTEALEILGNLEKVGGKNEWIIVERGECLHQAEGPKAALGYLESEIAPGKKPPISKSQ